MKDTYSISTPYEVRESCKLKLSPASGRETTLSQKSKEGTNLNIVRKCFYRQVIKSEFARQWGRKKCTLRNTLRETLRALVHRAKVSKVHEHVVNGTSVRISKFQF